MHSQYARLSFFVLSLTHTPLYVYHDDWQMLSGTLLDMSLIYTE